jgi:hypothetical protein
MQKEQKKVEQFKKVFEETAELGFNPACASMTTSDFDYEGYARYCKSRFSVIKRG